MTEFTNTYQEKMLLGSECNISIAWNLLHDYSFGCMIGKMNINTNDHSLRLFKIVILNQYDLNWPCKSYFKLINGLCMPICDSNDVYSSQINYGLKICNIQTNLGKYELWAETSISLSPVIYNLRSNNTSNVTCGSLTDLGFVIGIVRRIRNK